MALPIISLTNAQTDLRLRRPRQLQKLILRAIALCDQLQSLTTDDELVVTLVDSETIADVNERHLAHTGPTDVITFDYRDDLDDPDPTYPGETRTFGELMVCPAVAMQAAGQFATSPEDETVLYIVHGILHLCGYDDHSDDDRLAMRQAEARVMAVLRREFHIADLFGPAPATRAAAADSAADVVAPPKRARRTSPGSA